MALPEEKGNRTGFYWETGQEHAGKRCRTIALFAVTPCRPSRDNRPTRKGLRGDQLYVLKHKRNQQQAFYVLLLYLMVGMGGGDSQKNRGITGSAEFSIGRDKLNLAEFPMACLADRVPAGCEALVFEDTIWDKGQGKHVARRLTITPCGTFGLPTALDDEVILGLVQLTRADGFTKRRVKFTRYQLLRMLGWRIEGKSYARLDKSLLLWLGATLHYDNAWWDKLQNRWVDEHFHLLDRVTLWQELASPEKPAGRGRKSAPASFTWNEIVFRSFQAGYIKKLDMELYRSLRRPTAKRMFRFLDKRFYRKRQIPFPLRCFAHEHIGLSRCYDHRQLKRRLEPAIRELENAGFLEAMNPVDRYAKDTRGLWNVTFIKARQKRGAEQKVPSVSGLELELVNRGVSSEMATTLVRESDESLIHEKLEAFDRLRREGSKNVSKNPPGYLVNSIRKNYQSEQQPVTETVDVDSSSGSVARKEPKKSPPKRSDKRARAEKAEQQKVTAYRSQLSPHDAVQLEKEAFEQAASVSLDGYQRASVSVNHQRLEQYREIIIETHVRKILGLSSK